MNFLFTLSLCLVGAFNAGIACQAHATDKPLTLGVAAFTSGACGAILLFYLVGVMLIEPLQEAD